MWIFLSVCVDDDFLLHSIGFCCIYYFVKNIQENVSRNETKFRRSCTNTFQVLDIGHLVLWLVIMSSDGSSYPLINHDAISLVIMPPRLVVMPSNWSQYPLIGHHALWLVTMPSDWSQSQCPLICHDTLFLVIITLDYSSLPFDWSSRPLIGHHGLSLVIMSKCQSVIMVSKSGNSIININMGRQTDLCNPTDADASKY